MSSSTRTAWSRTMMERRTKIPYDERIMNIINEVFRPGYKPYSDQNPTKAKLHEYCQHYTHFYRNRYHDTKSCTICRMAKRMMRAHAAGCCDPHCDVVLCRTFKKARRKDWGTLHYVVETKNPNKLRCLLQRKAWSINRPIKLSPFCIRERRGVDYASLSALDLCTSPRYMVADAHLQDAILAGEKASVVNALRTEASNESIRSNNIKRILLRVENPILPLPSIALNTRGQRFESNMRSIWPSYTLRILREFMLCHRSSNPNGSNSILKSSNNAMAKVFQGAYNDVIITIMEFAADRHTMIEAQFRDYADEKEKLPSVLCDHVKHCTAHGVCDFCSTLERRRRERGDHCGNSKRRRLS